MKKIVFGIVMVATSCLFAVTNAPTESSDGIRSKVLERFIGPIVKAVEEKKITVANGVDGFIDCAVDCKGRESGDVMRRVILEAAFSLAVKHGEYEKAIQVLNAFRHLDSQIKPADLAALVKKAKIRKSAKTQVLFDYFTYLDVSEKLAPRILRIEPANGARNVNPETDKIVITFDRSMRSGYAFCRGEGVSFNYHPAMHGGGERPKWNEDHTQITFKAKLRPGTTYRACINRGEKNRDFKDVLGIPIKDTPYEFTTSGTFTPNPAWPKISDIEPRNGATGVDAGLDRIVVTFDREMKDGEFSVCIHKDGEKSDLPKFTGKLSYDENHRVLTIPVKLVPNKTYKLQFNKGEACGFSTPDGYRLEDYPYSFTTAR